MTPDVRVPVAIVRALIVAVAYSRGGDAWLWCIAAVGVGPALRAIADAESEKWAEAAAKRRHPSRWEG